MGHRLFLFLRSNLFLLVILGITLIAIPLTLLMTQKQQDIRQRASEADTTVYITPSTTTKPIDEVFDVYLEMHTTKAITGVDTTISYNKDLLDVVSITPSSLFNSVIHRTINDAAGTVRLTVVDTQGNVITGNNLRIGTIRVKLKQPGPIDFQLSSAQVTAAGQNTAVETTLIGAAFTGQSVTSTSTGYGMQVDLRESEKVPSTALLATLRPYWVRYVWTDNVNRTTLGSTNQLIIVNQETTGGAPLESTNVAAWKDYVDNTYVPKLTSVLNNTGITAIEVWNEPDLCTPGAYCPGMPAAAYGYLLKRAAATVKAKNASIQVVLGGLASGQTSYLTTMLAAEPAALNQVDAIGLHPYGKSPDGWRTDLLPFGNLAASIQEYRTAAQGSDNSIWVTEIGHGTDDQAFQAEYLTRVYNTLHTAGVPVVIWYSWIDSMGGNNGQSNWGLVNTSTQLKASGTAFKAITNPTTTPTPTISGNPSPTQPQTTVAPTAQPTPTPRPTATPIPSPTPCSGCITFTLSTKLPGIGKGAQENGSPFHPVRDVTFLLVDAQNNDVPPEHTGKMIFNPTTGYFDASVDMGQSILAGVYGLYAKSQGTLKKRAVNILTITPGQTTYPLPGQPLFIVGNISGVDNTLDIEDYNLFIDCFGAKKRNTAICDNADINDDATVDLLDYKYFIQMLQTARGD